MRQTPAFAMRRLHMIGRLIALGGLLPGVALVILTGHHHLGWFSFTAENGYLLIGMGWFGLRILSLMPPLTKALAAVPVSDPE